jgi:4-diphosphocytidyl-2-C-methyl-D-erythritol kinase
VKRVPVAAKLNLALVVGERRQDGLHDVATVLQRIDLCDWLALEPAGELSVAGFGADTLVRGALAALAEAAGVTPSWHVRLEKKIPVAAGLGGGSADAAAALALANGTLATPLEPAALAQVAARLGADVPFFLTPGPKLAEGAGERLRGLDLPQDYWALVALPRGAEKIATADVYARFDEARGSAGFAERHARLLDALAAVRRPRDFARFPPNDLAAAAGGGPLAEELLAGGAFHADVSGAGPAVFALYHRRPDAREAARRLGRRARTWIAAPVW